MNGYKLEFKGKEQSKITTFLKKMKEPQKIRQAFLERWKSSFSVTLEKEIILTKDRSSKFKPKSFEKNGVFKKDKIRFRGF